MDLHQVACPEVVRAHRVHRNDPLVVVGGDVGEGGDEGGVGGASRELKRGRERRGGEEEVVKLSRRRPCYDGDSRGSDGDSGGVVVVAVVAAAAAINPTTHRSIDPPLSCVPHLLDLPLSSLYPARHDVHGDHPRAH